MNSDEPTLLRELLVDILTEHCSKPVQRSQPIEMNKALVMSIAEIAGGEHLLRADSLTNQFRRDSAAENGLFPMVTFSKKQWLH